MTTNRARRTARSAGLLAVVAAAALSLTAFHGVGKDTVAAATKAAASPVRTQPLPDGSKAEIYKLGARHYRLKMVHHGDVLATMEANRHDAGLDANDMFIVLTPDGRVQSWMGGGHEGPGTFRLMGGWTAKVTKAGEGHYRARILGDAGGVSATLDANEHDAGVEVDRVYVVLSAGGVISAHA
ncbi:hypothetical protein ACWDGI_06430 [Streptomyces sp. NPDC001220]